MTRADVSQVSSSDLPSVCAPLREASAQAGRANRPSSQAHGHLGWSSALKNIKMALRENCSLKTEGGKIPTRHRKDPATNEQFEVDRDIRIGNGIPALIAIDQLLSRHL